jgi:hypothetical protein
MGAHSSNKSRGAESKSKPSGSGKAARASRQAPGGLGSKDPFTAHSTSDLDCMAELLAEALPPMGAEASALLQPTPFDVVLSAEEFSALPADLEGFVGHAGGEEGYGSGSGGNGSGGAGGEGSSSSSSSSGGYGTGPSKSKLEKQAVECSTCGKVFVSAQGLGGHRSAGCGREEREAAKAGSKRPASSGEGEKESEAAEVAKRLARGEPE